MLQFAKQMLPIVSKPIDMAKMRIRALIVYRYGFKKKQLLFNRKYCLPLPLTVDIAFQSPLNKFSMGLVTLLLLKS